MKHMLSMSIVGASIWALLFLAPLDAAVLLAAGVAVFLFEIHS